MHSECYVHQMPYAKLHQTQCAKFTRCNIPSAADAICQVHQTQYAKFTRLTMPSAADAICQVHHTQLPSPPDATCQVNQMKCAKWTRWNVPSEPDEMCQVHQMQYGKCTRWNMPRALDAICQVHHMQYAKCTRWNMPSQTENLYFAGLFKSSFAFFSALQLTLRYSVTKIPALQDFREVVDAHCIHWNVCVGSTSTHCVGAVQIYHIMWVQCSYHIVWVEFIYHIVWVQCRFITLCGCSAELSHCVGAVRS